MQKQFPQLITRIGRSKIHIVKSKFHRNFQPKHQKGRRVPINLQERVNNEIKKLLKEGHIEKLNNCSDQYFISPIVITVKRDQTIKLALDSKTLYKAIHKNKYQMPNIETLMDSISQIIINYKTEPADTNHRALLSILKEHRSNKSYNSRLSRWVDRLLPYQFSIEHLPGAKMGLVVYISRNPYQPAKSVSKYDEEFLVATLSSIHSDAQLLQQKHNLLAHSLNKLYIDIDGENKNSTTNTEQVLTIDYVKPNPQTKVHELFAPRNNSSKLCLKQTSNFDIKSAQRVRLTNVSSNLAARKYNSNVTSLKFNLHYSKHASRVHLTHNTKSFADQKHNSILHPTNSINCTSAHDQRVHSTQNDSVFAHT